MRFSNQEHGGDSPNSAALDADVVNLDRATVPTKYDDSWDRILEEIRNAGSTGPVQGRDKVIYIGDIHGASPADLDDDLRRVGFLNANRQWQNPHDRYLVQVGDLVDRGEHGLALYDRIAELQSQSEGRLIRLLGNHELYHLSGTPWQIGAKDIPGLQERLFRDILDRKVEAAYCERNTIYTHAGIDLKFFPELVGKEPEAICAILNRRFRDAVAKFHSAWERAGNDIQLKSRLSAEFLESDRIFDSSRGIFWTRGKIANDQFQQVVGHTPQSKGIRDNPGDRVKYVDVGRIFGELGHFDLVSSRALGANSAVSSMIRDLAHDMTAFTDFVRKGGQPFAVPHSFGQELGRALEILSELQRQNIKEISLGAGKRIDSKVFCHALAKLEETQPRAVEIFCLKFFGRMTFDEITQSMPEIDRTEARDLWKAVNAWLVTEFKQTEE